MKEEMASSYRDEDIAKKKDSRPTMSFDEFLQSTNTKVQSLDDSLKIQIKEGLTKNDFKKLKKLQRCDYIGEKNVKIEGKER